MARAGEPRRRGVCDRSGCAPARPRFPIRARPCSSRSTSYLGRHRQVAGQRLVARRGALGHGLEDLAVLRLERRSFGPPHDAVRYGHRTLPRMAEDHRARSRRPGRGRLRPQGASSSPPSIPAAPLRFQGAARRGSSLCANRRGAYDSSPECHRERAGTDRDRPRGEARGRRPQAGGRHRRAQPDETVGSQGSRGLRRSPVRGRRARAAPARVPRRWRERGERLGRDPGRADRREVFVVALTTTRRAARPAPTTTPPRWRVSSRSGVALPRERSRHLESRVSPALGLPDPGRGVLAFVPGVGLSDHWSFWRVGAPAVMVTDTAFFRNDNYHRPGDTPETLDYERMARVVAGLERALAELVGEA